MLESPTDRAALAMHTRAPRRAGVHFRLLACCSLLLACDGPVGPLPGGRLAGPDAACPSDWRAHAGEGEVELELRPEAPRSVRIWNVVVAGRLFVPGDFLTPIKRWPHQVLADPRVRIRIDGRIFRCEARRVEDPTLIETLRAEAAGKYALEPDGWAARSQVWWFELVPRPDEVGIRAPQAP